MFGDGAKQDPAVLTFFGKQVHFVVDVTKVRNGLHQATVLAYGF